MSLPRIHRLKENWQVYEGCFREFEKTSQRIPLYYENLLENMFGDVRIYPAIFQFYLLSSRENWIPSMTSVARIEDNTMDITCEELWNNFCKTFHVIVCECIMRGAITIMISKCVVTRFR